MTQRSLAVVVLAAGAGTRMKSATPKVLHRISGRTLLGHVLATAGELEPARTIVVVRHERDRIVEAIEPDLPGLTIVDQDSIPGTGRALDIAIPALGMGFVGDVVVLSADAPLVTADEIRAMLRRHRETGAATTLLGTRLTNPSGYGRIVLDATGAVERIVEEADASAEERAIDLVNAGTYVFDIGYLRGLLSAVSRDNAQGEVYLTDGIALQRSRDWIVALHEASDATVALGVNDRVQLAEAERVMNARIVRAHQLAGVTVRDPWTTWIDVDVTIGEDSEILPGTQLRGATAIGAHVVLGPDTTLTDTEVGDFAVIERAVANLAVVGAGATVGPFAYLRPGTVLGPAGKIGTYVETKNAVIGKGSKVPHLSYVGDVEIGEDTNLGASTITANYDGVHKHRTVIGSQVHTGVHNSLVAPVEIGDGATIGAGAVVRNDVPPGALAISVAPQRNLEGWAAEHAARAVPEPAVAPETPTEGDGATR